MRRFGHIRRISDFFRHSDFGAFYFRICFVLLCLLRDCGRRIGKANPTVSSNVRRRTIVVGFGAARAVLRHCAGRNPPATSESRRHRSRALAPSPARTRPRRMNERELLVDCLRRLNLTGINYYLTGSMASNYWGIPRTTHDLDFVIQMPPSSVSRIIQEFSGDFYIDEAAVRGAYRPPHQFNAIDTRSALKVDFWLPKPEPFDREMFLRRASVILFG